MVLWTFAQWQCLVKLQSRTITRVLSLMQSSIDCSITRRTHRVHFYSHTHFPSASIPGQLLASTHLLSNSMLLSFEECCMDGGVLDYDTIWIRLSSLSLILWRFMRVVARVSRLFLCIARQQSMIGEGNGNPLSFLAWEIPQTEKPGRLQSMQLQKSQTQLSN